MINRRHRSEFGNNMFDATLHKHLFLFWKKVLIEQNKFQKHPNILKQEICP